MRLIHECLRYFYSPLDRMLVHRRVTPALNSPVPIYTPGWREALYMRVKLLAHEHNAMSPHTRSRTRTVRPRVERTNHEATSPPTQVRQNTVHNLFHLNFPTSVYECFTSKKKCITNLVNLQLDYCSTTTIYSEIYNLFCKRLAR